MTDESLLQRRIADIIPEVFYRKTGMKYSVWNWNSLSKLECDLIMTEAGKIVQERMKQRR